MSRRIGFTLVILTLLGSTLACGSFGPPPSCGDEIGGTADEALFDEFFTGMELVSQETGQPNPVGGENGMQFDQGEGLLLLVESRQPVEVRLCIQPRGPGEIALDQTRSLPQGGGEFAIGPIETGTWVIRVIVDGTLVKNFPFEVK